MNNDLISRSELRKAVNDFYDNHFKGLVSNELITYAKAVDNAIDNAPTVDFEKLGESLNCQIRATYGSCDDCLLSCPRNELIKLLGLAKPQDRWGKWSVSEIQCPNCLEYFQTDCYSKEELNKCPCCGAKLRD